LGTAPDVVAAELKRAVITKEAQLTAFICGNAPEAAAKLATHGFDITKVPGPEELQSVLKSQQCAVVFGPNVAAKVVFELSRLIRATPALRRTPIIWQHRHDRPQWLQATRLDIFAVEELDDALTTRLHSLLAKAAADAADQDTSTTSVLSWEAARVLIDRTLVAAHRSGSHVAVATIRLNGAANEEELTRIKRLLADEFRRGDIIGLRQTDDLVIALDKVSRSVATNRMRTLMDRLDLDDGAARVGVSMFPTDGRSGDELAAAADRAADLAQSHQGPSVASTTWRPAEENAPDVMVVDADPVLGKVLTSGLANAGLRAVHEDDGRQALATLTNGTDASIPRLLLLDLDAPGIDGLSMLRQLRASGVMAQLNVLLMTSRSSESDLKVALELGISDVIRKPFSATLLMHRVHMLLENER
jgi:CheY-like chemotaxis protein